MFTDRSQAGKRLAEQLEAYRSSHALVIGLARGGVVVAKEIAGALSLPLDVLVVKKIPSPFQRELALGALAPDGVSVVDYRLAQREGADERYLGSQRVERAKEIRTKTLVYRKGRKPPSVRDREVIVVDDGAATGATIEAAVKWLKKKKAKAIIVALPVAPPDIVGKIQPEVDTLIVLETPSDFGAVGQFYDFFPQIEDEEVVALLKSDKSVTPVTV